MDDDPVKSSKGYCSAASPLLFWNCLTGRHKFWGFYACITCGVKVCHVPVIEQLRVLSAACTCRCRTYVKAEGYKSSPLPLTFISADTSTSFTHLHYSHVTHKELERIFTIPHFFDGIFAWRKRNVGPWRCCGSEVHPHTVCANRQSRTDGGRSLHILHCLWRCPPSES